jgi:site-specific recombinase XerD
MRREGARLCRARGEDPAADKAALRRSQALSDLIDTFLTEHAVDKRKASTVAWYRHGLEHVVKPALGHLKPESVTRQNIARLHSSMRQTPAQANRVLARIGALYGWAAKSGYVAEGYNPARGN